MKETGRIKLKEIPFSQTFETGNGEELCNATGYAVQFDNEKTPLGFPLFWNEDAIGADNTVAVHIRHIREKIEINPKEPRYLKVVWGVGYKIDKN